MERSKERAALVCSFFKNNNLFHMAACLVEPDYGISSHLLLNPKHDSHLLLVSDE